MPTVKFYKTIYRFTLFNLPVDHLHKLISPFFNRIHKNGVEATVCVYNDALWTRLLEPEKYSN